jgi:hypothetical protein
MEETPQETIVPQPLIAISDLLNSVEVVTKKEQDDKVLLESIGNMSFLELREKLVLWAIAEFPSVYEINKVHILPPTTCSDGVTRGLDDYIAFCSGKTISEHVSILQQKVTGIVVSFANMGTYISIVVSKA